MRQFCAQRPFHHRLGQLRQQSFPPQNLLRPVMRRNPSVNQRPLEQRLFFLKSFPVPFPRLCLLRLRFLQVFFVHVLFLLFSLKTRTQTFGYARGFDAPCAEAGAPIAKDSRKKASPVPSSSLCR